MPYKTAGLRFFVDCKDKHLEELENHLKDIAYDVVAVLERRTRLIIDSVDVFLDVGDGEAVTEVSVDHD